MPKKVEKNETIDPKVAKNLNKTVLLKDKQLSEIASENQPIVRPITDTSIDSSGTFRLRMSSCMPSEQTPIVTPKSDISKNTDKNSLKMKSNKPDKAEPTVNKQSGQKITEYKPLSSQFNNLQKNIFTGFASLPVSPNKKYNSPNKENFEQSMETS